MCRSTVFQVEDNYHLILQEEIIKGVIRLEIGNRHNEFLKSKSDLDWLVNRQHNNSCNSK